MTPRGNLVVHHCHPSETNAAPLRSVYNSDAVTNSSLYVGKDIAIPRGRSRCPWHAQTTRAIFMHAQGFLHGHSNINRARHHAGMRTSRWTSVRDGLSRISPYPRTVLITDSEVTRMLSTQIGLKLMRLSWNVVGIL